MPKNGKPVSIDERPAFFIPLPKIDQQRFNNLMKKYEKLSVRCLTFAPAEIINNLTNNSGVKHGDLTTSPILQLEQIHPEEFYIPVRYLLPEQDKTTRYPEEVISVYLALP